jgi:hypothetical protein
MSIIYERFADFGRFSVQYVASAIHTYKGAPTPVNAVIGVAVSAYGAYSVYALGRTVYTLIKPHSAEPSASKVRSTTASGSVVYESSRAVDEYAPARFMHCFIVTI